MNKQQEEFLRLAVVEQKKYKEISGIMNVDRKQLSAWSNELRTEWEALSSLRKIWWSKRESMGFWEFKKWFETAERRCHYCGITEPEIFRLKERGQIHTKRWTTRGQTRVIDRMASEESYDKLENLVFCCYWCNNAKTDEFSAREFSEIGKVIKKIWEARSRRIERFTTDGSEIHVVSPDDNK